MKFIDLAAQYQSIKKEIDEAIESTIASSSFIMGPAVEELENSIAKYCGTKYAIGLNSGSDALLASMKVLHIGANDEVIVPSYTYIASVETVFLAGAKPVLVDIDPTTYNIDPDCIKKVITSKTKAIMPVHLYGQPAQMDIITKIAKQHNLFTIEDTAQAIGANFNNQKVGSFGDTGCISFFPTKNLGAYGDAGMVVTNNQTIADYLKVWRIHGQNKKYFTDFIGDSSRLDTLQAAILLVKLKHIDEWAQKRRENAQLYNSLLNNDSIIKPVVGSNCTHVFHQYTIRAQDKRDELQQYLKKHDIPSIVYYPIAQHMQKAYQHLGYKTGSIPHSEQAAKETLSLPNYPEMPEEDIHTITKIIQKFYST